MGVVAWFHHVISAKVGRTVRGMSDARDGNPYALANTEGSAKVATSPPNVPGGPGWTLSPTGQANLRTQPSIAQQCPPPAVPSGDGDGERSIVRMDLRADAGIGARGIRAGQ
jgi:hypothetical protein